MGVFKPVDPALKFAQSEAAILKFWQTQGIFEKSLKARESVKDSKHWVFYEGPPTANGKPHPGHVLTRVVKDLFPRYKTMCGYYVPRKAGWDTHGLPVEIEVEKELKLDGKSEIEKYGVEPFVRKCMDSVFRYTTDWENLTNRIGFWIDLADAYVTYHQSYVESVWWSLKELHARNLLYRGHKILPWCPHCQTALSSHEVGLGYEEVEDPSVFVTFRDVDYDQNKTSFLAWTTTPWTLPSNAGLALKADTEYSHVKVGEEILIMASALVKQVMGKMKHEVVKTEPGRALVRRPYQPLFNFVKKIAPHVVAPASIESSEEIFSPASLIRGETWTIAAADFVTLDTGSGIVHVAPAFGADDYKLGVEVGWPVICLVKPDGTFTKACQQFSGRFVKEADNDLIRDLKERKLLLKRENYKHDYPFCWRCKNPLIYFARGGWFIRTTQEIAHVIENNKKVDWHPEHIKAGRFGSFLDSNIDWALSRERYWGTPLPIWQCACGHEEAVASFAELKEKPGAKGLDAFDVAKQKDPTLNEHLRVHKPWIDAAMFSCPKCGKEMKRTPEVIDCWYDSGAMPFAQWGYPHLPGSKEKFELAFPADFISEAIDQTRGWFYSLIAESTLLFPANSAQAQSEPRASASGSLPAQSEPRALASRPLPYGRGSYGRGSERPYPHPYKTCLVLGHVCDEKGEKMSKSKGNYLDPNLILSEEGADALRWFFYSSTNPWTSARFSRPAVREAQKEFLVKLRNVYSFFVIYANIDGFDPADFYKHGDTVEKLCVYDELDLWVISELHITTRTVREKLDAYDIYAAASALSDFIEALSNWWLRRSRERFWRSWQHPLSGESRFWTETAVPLPQYMKSDDPDRHKVAAYVTLYTCLVSTSQLIAPFVPFFAEELWQNLVVGKIPGAQESVHLSSYPVPNDLRIDAESSDEVRLIREVASAGRSARLGAKIKTRQPLPKVVIVVSDESKKRIISSYKGVLLDELNVKDMKVRQHADEFVTYEYKPNFKAIGAKYRELVPAIKASLASANGMEVRESLINTGKATLVINAGGTSREFDLTGQELELTSDELEVVLRPKEGYAAASGKSVVVVLDTHLTPELLEEGVARELVNRINGWRGDLNLAYEQRIKLALKGSPKLEAVAQKFREYITRETLAAEQKVGDLPPGCQTLEIEIDGEKATLGMSV